MDRGEPHAASGAGVRRALSEYHAARLHLQELNRHEPAPDEPDEVHQDFERLVAEALRDEHSARDMLGSAVAAFAGSAPCAVIVDSPGGSSVIALSGRPDRMIVAAAADRVPIQDVLCRPEPPP